MKKYVEFSVISLNLVAFAAAFARSFAVNRIVEVTSNAAGNSDVEVDGEGRDLARYEADHTIDEVLALLPSEQFIKVTVKTKDENDYASGSEPVKLLNLNRVIYFEASGADDTKVAYYKNGFKLATYIVNETYAAFKTAVATARELAPDGTLALPGIAFETDPDTGFYRIAGNIIGIAAGGVQIGQLDPNGISVIGNLMRSGAHVNGAGVASGDATLLNGGLNIVDVAAAGTGVRVNNVALGTEYIIVNNGANALNIYPHTGNNFQGLAANVAIALAAGKKAIVMRDPTDATKWHYLLFA